MKALQNLFRPRVKSSVSGLATRLLQVFEAHNVDLSQVPRLIPQLKYSDLQSPKLLTDALTPSVIDAAAQLFGVRKQWLEGLDDLMVYTISDRGNPKGFLARLAAVPYDRVMSGKFSLRVLTTSMNLERGSGHQSLLPVIVEPIGDLEDVQAYRCQISGDRYTWADTQSRLELKAITWLLFHSVRTPVPLFEVSDRELQNIRNGMVIPSVVWRKGLVTEPSLEDFVLSHDQSRVAKETDELPAVLNYLDAQGLREFTFEAPPAAAKATQEDAPPDTTAAVSESQERQKESIPGKRDAQRNQWTAIVAAAQTTWSRDPDISITAMIRLLQKMPHLKANSLSESAIHKHIRDVAPPGVRGKPGRKSNKSA